MLSSALVERLKERRPEIEAATLARVYAVADPSEVDDPEYAIGLREAVSAGIEYAIAGIDSPRLDLAPVPDKLLAQARAAARNRVSLDTVLRRYLAAHTLLGDFIVQEGKDADFLLRADLQRSLRAQAALLDRLVIAVSTEYECEAERKACTRDQHRVECAERLLAGDPIDASELNYDVDAHHLAAVAVGTGVEPSIRAIAKVLELRLLLLSRDATTHWAWFGASRPIERAGLDRLLASRWPAGSVLTTGEPASGRTGWCFTHRQAAAALPIALRGSEPCVRYADVALLSSIVGDEVLTRSLWDLYLAPLRETRDGGVSLRKTLRAYFDAEGNVSSTASALGVTRKTVNSRLQAIERCLGRPLGTCASDLETALSLESLRADFGAQIA